MQRTLLESVLQRVVPLAEDRASDTDLLRRFAAGRDEAAFAVLIRRHGPLVWAVCRSLLPLEADAEDAFQATFLALVRSARTVRAATLGPWLHGVACRVSLKVRRTAARRKLREQSAARPEAARPLGATAWERLRNALHEEVCRLPEPLRRAFVLCELEGVGQREAAAALGWKLGTLSGRLCKARMRLIDRLSRHGVTAGAAVAAAATGGAATAAAPAELTARVLDLARTGGDLSGVSTTILVLARGATEVSMTRTKLLAAAAALAVVLAAGIATTLIPSAIAQRAPNQPAAQYGAVKPSDPNYAGSSEPVKVSDGRGGPWEYRFVPRTSDSLTAFERLLNEQSAAGWEYCGSEALRPDRAGGGELATPTLIFKRQRSAAGARALWSRSPDGRADRPIDLDRFSGKSNPADFLSIELKYASASSLAKTLQQLFGDNDCRIVSDERTNTLLLQGSEATLRSIRAVLEKLDAPPRKDSRPAK